jgi:hypothetical protein
MDKLFNFVDEAFYINLDHRTDKDKLFTDHFKELGILKYVKRSRGISPGEIGFKKDEATGKYEAEGYARGCTQAQINIIQYAKDKGLSNVLYFEDDAIFFTSGNYDPFNEISIAIDSLKKITNWEILFLGTNPGDRDKKFDMVAPNLIKINESIANHAVLINCSIFDKILQDYKSWTINHLDLYFSETFKEKYSVYPLCSIQRDDIVNDIGPHNYNGLDNNFWLEMYKKNINKLY